MSLRDLFRRRMPTIGSFLNRELSAAHVRWAYRLLLDREPESEEIVISHLNESNTTEQLRHRIFASQEFRSRNLLHPGLTPESTIVLAEIEPDLRIFVDLSDVVIGLNIARGLYEPQEASFVRGTVGAGDNVLDIGANVGFFSVLMASLAGSAGRVVSFEPVEQNLRLLERTISENRFQDRIALLPCAVGDQKGQAHLVHLPLSSRALNSGGSYLMRGDAGLPAGHEVVDADQVRLDDLDLPRPIHFIKIDIEGAEPLAFRGGRELLRKDRPTILCEINPTQLQKVSGVSAEEFLGEMQELGYRCARLEGEGPGATLKRFGPDIINVVFQPAS